MRYVSSSANDFIVVYLYRIFNIAGVNEVFNDRKKPSCRLYFFSLGNGRPYSLVGLF